MGADEETARIAAKERKERREGTALSSTDGTDWESEAIVDRRSTRWTGLEREGAFLTPDRSVSAAPSDPFSASPVSPVESVVNDVAVSSLRSLPSLRPFFLCGCSVSLRVLCGQISCRFFICAHLRHLRTSALSSLCALWPLWLKILVFPLWLCSTLDRGQQVP
jgi:hypothetical protein